jgi:transketolase
MKNYINTGSKDTRSGFGAGMTELKKKTWWHFVLI